MAQPAPASDFQFDDSLAEWNVPAKEWLARNEARLRERRLKLNGLATGNLVFNPDGRILVIQRASHDSMPDRWEVPGGAVDDDDPTVLHGAAREMWEEAGLVAKRFIRLATEGPNASPLQIFPNRYGTRWFCKFSFHVDVDACDDVRLDPSEHQAFVWASEDEIRAQRIGHRPLLVTTETMLSCILEAFRVRKEMNQSP